MSAIAWAVASTLLTSCQSNSSTDAKRPTSGPTTVQWQVTPLHAPVVDLPIQQGRLPLAYLADVAGTVRVSDMTDRRDLVTCDVDARTIIAVSDRGVWVGGNLLFGGPLAADHVYGVYFDVAGGPSELRRGKSGPSR
jgi:hypothetical protein